MGVLECEKRSAKTGFLIVVGTLKKGRIQTIKPARCGLYFNSGSGGWIRTNDLRVMSPTSYQTAPPRGALGGEDSRRRPEVKDS